MGRTGLFYLLAAAFFFSLMTVCVKLAGVGLPAEEIILARALVGLVLSLIAAKSAKLSLRGVDRGRLILRGIFGSGGLYCFFYAVTVLPLAEVTTIHYTNPILTALLAAVLLGEGLGWGLALALALSLSGVVVVARPALLFGGAEALDPVAVGIALLGAVFSAAAYVTVRGLRKTDDPIIVVLYFPIVATPIFLPLAARVWVWPDALQWLTLLGVGVSTQIAQICLTRGLHLVPAGRGTAVGYVQIAFAMAWSWFLFDERIDALALLGATMVVAGTAIVALAGREDGTQQEEAATEEAATVKPTVDPKPPPTP